MTTNNAVNTSLIGQTGTGAFVGSTSPVLVTPNIGVATSQSLAFSTNNGTLGITNGSAAPAGSVGEVISSLILVSGAVALPNTVVTDITSIPLTAGSWMVIGNVTFEFGAPITSVNLNGWINNASATSPDSSMSMGIFTAAQLNNSGWPVPARFFNFSTTTTVYLTALANYGSSSITGCGGIFAVRIR